MARKNSFAYLNGVVTLQLDVERCIGCAICTEVCPHEVFISAHGKALMVRRDSCMECSACARTCPTQALRVEAGEGCVRAIINELLGREGDCC